MQKAVEINSRNYTLRGMVHIPENKKGKIPLVVILHGFGGNKMGPNFVLVKLSRILEENNIASVRFDFAGSGESDGDFEAMTLSAEIADAENILDYVKALDFVDKENIGLVGYSMGGAIASVLAGNKQKDIKALSLWAPAGNIEEIVKNNFIGKGYYEYIQQGYYDFEGLKIGKDFVDDLSRVNIYGIASKYKGNVLLIHGDKDDVVPFEASKRYISESYGEKAELITASGANHMFGSLIWSKTFIDNTLEFFKKELI